MSDRLTPEELIAQMASDSPPLVLDVRSADKFEAGHVPGATHLPLAQIQTGAADVPAGRTLVVY